MANHYFRQHNRRQELIALGYEALALTRTHTIKQMLVELPALSRATLYRAMHAAIDDKAKVQSLEMAGAARTQADADVDPLLL